MKWLRSNRFWIVLIGMLLAASLLASYLVLRGMPNVHMAVIVQDGEIVRTIDLQAVTEPYEFVVEGAHGANTIRVEYGRICVAEANCPDKTCVRHGWVVNAALPAVCLPNKLVVRVENAAAAPDYDARTQ